MSGPAATTAEEATGAKKEARTAAKNIAGEIYPELHELS